MIIKDLFKKDIDRSIQGVVTIGNEDEEQKWQELEEYVCTDEIVRCFRTFFRRYRESMQTPTGKMGVWITGFFGSGKSHFLKILGYILENEVVAGVKAADYFDDKIKDQMVLGDIKASAKANNKIVLFNIDSKAKAGTKNNTQAIMDIMLRSFNEAIGYCGSNPWVADMERTLENEGKLDDFVSCFEELSGKDWKQTRAKALLNRDYIIKALVKARDMSEESAKQFIDDQTKNFTNTTEEFAQIVNDYCVKNKTRVIFLMDEVGQFIGDNTQLMLNLQTCTEDLGKYCRGQVWVVVTSQQELKAMIDSTKEKQQDFSKIQGRFDTRLLLSGANADEVIKRRILEKKDIAVNPLKSLYEANSSKLSNLIMFQAKPTWSGYKDAEEFKDVYPFVSYQFELLQKVFESIREHGMSEGKHLSQNERSLLSAFQESAKKYADQQSGLLVPFDSFYSTIEQFIDYDIKTVFTNAAKRASLDDFSIRVLRVLFMIKHVKEMPATIDRLSTLMIESINEDKAALKDRILNSLKLLEDETLVQKNGDQYDFLTNAEQDVNKDINKSGWNEGEVKRNIFDIVYDSILENNKYRYEGKYEFPINRFIDDETKGSFNQDGLTMKVITGFSNYNSSTDYAAESMRSNSIVVDLHEGTFVDELIKANKIDTYKRNNSATMSASLTEIMSKKAAERSDRVKRAEDIIRTMLKEAPIYINGALQEINQKDGKSRLLEALKLMVKNEYYKLGLVKYNYPDQRTLSAEINDNTVSYLADDLKNDANSGAYDEINSKIDNDFSLRKTVTLKGLVDHYKRKPYGWNDLDVVGMVAKLWKYNVIDIFIHENLVETNDPSVRLDLAHKNNLDKMVLRKRVITDPQVLYQVKRIMNEVYSENCSLDENTLKDEVRNFFTHKKNFIDGLKSQYGNSYAGHSVAAEIYRDFDSILRCGDNNSLFNEIISRKQSLEDHVEILEQLEAFYKEGSSQQKSFQDALDIIDWYTKNQMFVDLSRLDETINKMNEIVKLDMPFTRMNELNNLVFKSAEIKDAILEDKYKETKRKLEADRNTINKEHAEASMLDLTDDQKYELQSKADAIAQQYDSWLGSLHKNSSNMDSYISSSSKTVENFRKFIAQLMSAGGGATPPRSKSVSVINCIPIANKKIRNEADIDKVVSEIRNKLLSELKDTDELNLY